jgi:UDP-2,3-diacylglucosamine pyrophosphatase LpxH
MKERKNIATVSSGAVQQKTWNDIISKCIEVHNGAATWKEVSAFAASRGITMSADFIRQGCRILFAALDNGLQLNAPDAANCFDAGLNKDSKTPYQTEMTGEEITNMYIVTGARLQQFYAQNKVSYDAIREYFGISDDFIITSAKVNNWNVGTKGGAAQLKVALKPKAAKDFTMDDARKVVKEVLSDAPTTIVQYPAPNIKGDNNRFCNRHLVWAVNDLHFGQKASADVCGLEVNRNVTRENMLNMTDEFVESHIGCPYDGVTIAFSGDFVHADNCAKTTTKGTPQDCDGSMHEIVNHACKLSIEIVTKLKQLGIHITYRYVPGNHDRILGYTVALATQAWFRNDPQVTFVLTESDTDAFLYGNTVIGFAHGEFPDSRAHNMFMGRYRSLFNQAKQAEVILGHLHQEKVTNPTGICKVRRTIQAGVTEEWTAGKLFNYEYIRGTQCFVYDKTKGLVATEYYHCTY